MNFFIPKSSFTYLPVTLVTYRVDKWLHFWWADKYFHSWAPGIRLDTALIHAGAALFLWRLLVRLRFSETRSFFIALLFACHPLACETVCWVSERKNAVSALFGFGAIWIQARAFLRPSQAPEAKTIADYLRVPAVCLFYILSLMGKPSALGLLPVLLALESAVLFPKIRARLLGDTEAAAWRSSSSSIASYLGMGMLIVIALVCLQINISAHVDELTVPPGGSIFSALLTDLQIFSRYIFNLACPVGLSAAYYIDPMRSLADPRTWYYGAVLAGVIGSTLYYARNRWLCAFGWFWFFSGLSTNANIVAINHWMQDRYIYLSTPGFLIAASEGLAGFSQRYGDERQRRTLGLAFGSIMAAAFMAISGSRGYAWASTLKMSLDATQKQPQSFFAHYTLSCALYPPASHTTPGTPEYELFHRAWKKELLTALNDCPDYERYNFKQGVASDLGKDAYAQGDAVAAEKYFNIAITKMPLARDFGEAHGISLAYLSLLDLYYKRDPEIALDKAKESYRIYSCDQTLFALGSAYVACAQRNPHAKAALLAEARKWLNLITKGTPIREDADSLIKQLDNPAPLPLVPPVSKSPAAPAIPSGQTAPATPANK